MEDLLNNIDDFLIILPDKIVADDIKNFLTKNTNTHFFSNIYEGKTLLNPTPFIKHFSNSETIYLYEGSLGSGNYIRVVYSIKEKKYIYYTINEKKYVYYKINQDQLEREDFKSDNWLEFHSYVCKKILEYFIQLQK
jgi:hypothetical protein